MGEVNKKQCLLLVGSPRGLKSNSYKIGSYLLNKMLDNGFIVKEYLLMDFNSSNNKSLASLMELIQESEIIVLTSPLYVDSLPSIVIGAMEIIAEKCCTKRTENKPGFLAVINSGFPEAVQNDTALKICFTFARKTGFKWLGGIKIGGGPAIGKQVLEDKKGLLKNMVKGLDMAAERLAKGEALTEDVLSLLNKSLAPKWLYLTILNFGWWFQARKYNAHKKIYDMPYQDGE